MSDKKFKIMQFSDGGELVDTVSGVKASKNIKFDEQEKQQAWDKEMACLRTWNLRMMYLHLFSGTAQMVLSISNQNANSFRIPITSLLQNWDSGVPKQNLQLVHLATLMTYVATFSLLSAMGHAAVLIYWKSYECGLYKGMNRFRWAEYSLSNSLMITLFFGLWGNFDFVQLSGCFCLGICTIAFGDLHETLNSGKKPKDVNWYCFYYGGLCSILVWVIMAYGILTYPEKDEIPWWIWVAVGVYFAFFNCFPYTMIQQYRQVGKFNNELYPNLHNGGYLKGEMQYIFLSLASKFTLSWLIASSVIGPDKDIWKSIEGSI